MLFLLFQLGAERYALDARRVESVLPLVELQALAGAPRAVAGVFNYRGTPVPVVDLRELIWREPVQLRLATRIILIKAGDSQNHPRWLGLIAENVSRMVRKELSEFQESALRRGEPPFLGPMLFDQQGIIRLLREDRLLSHETSQALYSTKVNL